jgi:hypothetical protein
VSYTPPGGLLKFLDHLLASGLLVITLEHAMICLPEWRMLVY